VRKFRFRLETLRWHRLHIEDAKAAVFTSAQFKRMAAQSSLAEIQAKERMARMDSLPSNPGHMALRDLYLEHLADRIVEQEGVVDVLAGEEETARQEWLEARRNREVVDKLRDKALARHRADELREEQGNLDEWAVLRNGVARAS